MYYCLVIIIVLNTAYSDGNALFQRAVGKYLANSVVITECVDNEVECAGHCSNEMWCKSVNYQHSGAGKGKCELNNKAIDYFKHSNDCRTKQEFNYLGKMGPINRRKCCVLLKPCLNGGICSPVLSLDSKSCFRCACKAGFYGNRCEIKRPKSCADYLTTDTVKPISAKYEILDNHEQPYMVFCDFASESGFAWTLLLSNSRNNSDAVQNNALYKDHPINKDTFNWKLYRLPVSRMNSIKSHSTHWRATCAYDVNGFDNEEYVRVELSVEDLSAPTYTNSTPLAACRTIEYMKMFGKICNNCSFALYHKDNILPFFVPESSKNWSKCPFDLSNEQYYCDSNRKAKSALFRNRDYCYDPRSKCQTTDSSTTQMWFGKRIA